MATAPRRRPRGHAPPGTESFESGVIVPVRWAQDMDQRAALRSAVGTERAATVAVLIGVALLVLLGLVRMVIT